jgi:hypothetical protein
VRLLAIVSIAQQQVQLTGRRDGLGSVAAAADVFDSCHHGKKYGHAAANWLAAFMPSACKSTLTRV